MTRSMIRKQFEQDQEKKTEKSINLSPSINNSSDLLRIKSKYFSLTYSSREINVSTYINRPIR